MAENNKTYRIRTNVGANTDSFLNVKLDQEYDSLEILSLKIADKDTYKLHNSDYGVVVGRVLANGNFGVPNAKISVFIPADEQNAGLEIWNLYPYTSTTTKNEKDIRYNLLPDESVKDCHKPVGTFPNKTLLLENDSLLEVFDDYYIYTTRTNAAGDYLICGVPTGMQTIHMDLDLSDCGILSQRPRDFVYKGYTIEQFENPNQFKKDENIDGLSQIFSQNQPVYVQPFWGNEENGDEIGITRADIEISFKFEPTCVFMGSAISDNASNGVGKKCVPTNQMGAMDELTAGEGTIEMIRKTPGGSVEEFAIKGNQVINGNGVWCYQIPMNLDYMMTDEYGNMVPTDDPEKGIPTRTRVRFRASLTDMDGSSQSYYRAKYLIPNNPGIEDQKVDYNFGTYTDESSYRDLFWNGVYTVKSYIPRFQKSKRWKSERFSGIKACNYYGNNNPMPYNNMRIRLPFMFTVLCIFVKLFIKIVSLVNRIIAGVLRVIAGVIGVIFSPLKIVGKALTLLPMTRSAGKKLLALADDAISLIINPFIKRYGIHCTFIGDGLCPDMEGWYFAPGCTLGERLQSTTEALMKNTLAAAMGSGDNLEDLDNSAKEAMNSTEFVDETSTDTQNTTTSEEESVCLTRDVDYLVNCFEMNLAQEYRVIKFDFYNDWVNGVIYFPRWMRKVKRKKKYKISFKKGDNLITTYYKDKVFGCMNAETSRVKKSRYYTQQCSLAYTGEANKPWTTIKTAQNCYGTAKVSGGKQTGIIPSKCHKKQGMDQSAIFGKKSGLVTEETTMLGQFVYYLKPCEWKDTNNGKVRTLLFATDIVLLGTLNDCDENGIPQAFKYLNNSSYVMPTNLALTTMDDDAYIYSSGKGTVCSSTGSRSNNGKKKLKDSEEESVRRITPNYETTNKAYAKTDGDQVNYGENDDPIPVTEAAGINWNYSGPGQDDVALGKLEKPAEFIKRLFGAGNKRFDFLYYPGGHFLGLSCVNSDTNIKSCVNLKRICELGATMSQRREEMRGYDANGLPKYEYFVPTGLISNVDIETATFRAMFATLNHNKLIATQKNPTTGYKKYDFRFLRPDGFDGSLKNYVHKNNSPYNTKLTEDMVSDSSTFFENMFRGLWTAPDDYDPEEKDHTSRRTIESAIYDYYMFRFGLNGFADKEQKLHYLSKKNGGYILPQYENSFYFYFGLKDGSTALDEFKKQFFSECESNRVLKTPTITVKEKISDEDLSGKATIIVDNMIPPYTITIKDNTAGDDWGPTTTENDIFNFESFTGTEPVIGHEYTVTITDSIDQTVEKTFIFGASAIKVNAQSIHFRVKANGPTNDPKKGGYVKINDVVKILKKEYRISSGAISFRYRKYGSSGWSALSGGNYTDATGDLWHLYYLPSTGVYEIAIQYNGVTVSILTVTMDDNTMVNLFVACDYLAYKPEYDPMLGDNKPCYHGGLRTLSVSELENGTPFQGASWENWLMRHTFYRQTENDTLAYDNYIYTKEGYEIAIFGQAECGTTLNNANLKGTGTDAGGNTPNNYANDYNEFVGRIVDDTHTYIPTMLFNPATKKEENGVFRNMFDAMSYTDDGRAAADASNITITSYDYNDGVITLRHSGTLPKGHGAIVVFENGIMIFPVEEESGVLRAHDFDVYPNNSYNSQILAMATVYPTLQVPSMYKPFYGIVSAATWSVVDLTLTLDENNRTVTEKKYLPLSYKVEGDIYNGLTFNNRFYSGNTAGEGEVQTYDTYLVFNNDNSFFNNLTSQTQNDFMVKRKIYPSKRFGESSFEYSREISKFSEDENEDKEISEIAYSIKEALPVGSMPENVFTERYEDGFDQNILRDSCSVEDAFYDDLKLKIYDASPGVGVNGPCSIYTEEKTERPVILYATTTPLFNRELTPLFAEEDGGYFYYGVYNENIPFGVKGTHITVTGTSLASPYFYPAIQSNGATINKFARNEDELYASGVTLLHKHTLLPTYRLDINEINKVITGSTTIPVTVLNETGSQDATVLSSGAEYKTLIAITQKRDDETRNKLFVYKLYPIETLDLMFPASPGGVDAYMKAPKEVGFTKDAQSATITVSVNVKFRVIKSCDWVTLTDTEYDATATTISISMPEYTGTSESRDCSLTLHCIDEGVEVDDVTIKVIQFKNEIQEVRDEMGELEDSVNSALDNMQSQIDSLSGNTGN